MKASCASLLEWATRAIGFEAVASEPNKFKGADVKVISHVLEFIGGCLASFKALVEPTAPGAEYAAAKALREWLERYEQVCFAKLFVSVLHREAQAHQCMDLLPENLRAIAHAMDINWGQLVEDLQAADTDLVSLFEGLQKFEAANSLVFGNHSNLVKNALESDSSMAKPADFQSIFSSSLVKAIDQTQEVALPPLERFLEKFKDVPNAATVSDLEWIHKQETEEDTKKDLEGFVEANANWAEVYSTLQKFGEHSTENEDLKKILDKCNAFAKEGQSKAKQGTVIATTILFSNCLVAGIEDKDDLTQLETYTKKTFGTTMESLPEKILSQVQALAPKAVKSGKQDKKEKDKKEKTKVKKTKEDQKGEKRGSEDVKGSKPKKSKH